MDHLIGRNDFLRLYGQYIKATESPKIMHIWSAIAVVSACMGRHVKYPFALGDIYANQYIVLVGPPATKKSTALKLAADLLKDTDVKFAPDDTGGQRQGLIAALQGALPDKQDEADDVLDALNNADFGMEGLGSTDPTGQTNRLLDAHVRFAVASEFGSFVGENNSTMTRFLIRMWDGDDYSYKLKNEVCTLKEPLLTIAGATTVDDIAKCIPVEAAGQGFLSRIIFVHASKKERELPPSRTKLDKQAAIALKSTLLWINNTMTGEMLATEEADAFVDEIYLNKIKMDDGRFVYYTERRFTHTIKLAMCLCAMRRSMLLEREDFELADDLLKHTERFMPDALGEYGMSKLSAAKQQLVEFLISQGCPVNIAVVYHILRRDLEPREINIVVEDLISGNKIVRSDLPGGIHLTAIQDDTANLLATAIY